jgi:hypothetical protein
MQELFPLARGLLLGVTIGFVRPTLQLPIGPTLAIVLELHATVVTREFKTGRGYLLVDIPLVASATVIGCLFVRHLRPAIWRSHQ